LPSEEEVDEKEIENLFKLLELMENQLSDSADLKNSNVNFSAFNIQNDN